VGLQAVEALALTFSHSVSAPPTQSGSGLWAFGETCSTWHAALGRVTESHTTPMHFKFHTSRILEQHMTKHTVGASAGVTTPGVHQRCAHSPRRVNGSIPQADTLSTGFFITLYSPSVAYIRAACKAHWASAAAAAACAARHLQLYQPMVSLQ
jgi:hypothetical protein